MPNRPSRCWVCSGDPAACRCPERPPDGWEKIRAADLMGSARLLECDGVKIADRRAKSGGTPYVQFNKKAQV